MDVPLPCRASWPGFQKLVSQSRKLEQPVSPYQSKQLDMVEQYLFRGAPYGLDESKLAKTPGKHNFSDKEDQALCLDSLAGFAAEGFVVGPLPLDAIETPKLIGAFTREQESSAKKRVISDLSQPRSGGSFNDALSTKPVDDWPMIDPGRVEDAVALIIDNGRGAVFCKIDVSSAYKVSKP